MIEQTAVDTTNINRTLKEMGEQGWRCVAAVQGMYANGAASHAISQLSTPGATLIFEREKP